MTMLERARRLLAMGVSTIPLKHGTKEPAIKSWKVYRERLPTDDELVQWYGDGTPRNMGIVLGKVSGLIVVESDTPEAEAACAKHLPPTPMMTRSARGFHRYYLRPPTNAPIPASIELDGVSVEVKRDGQYVVGPGSLHPDGVEYTEVEQ